MTLVQQSSARYDIPGMVTHLRIAASEARTLADIVTPAFPVARRHLLRAAEALDHAATDLSNYQLVSAASYIQQANNEIPQATAAVNAGGSC